MKKAFLNKIVIGAIMATTMTTLTPLGVSAATTNSKANNDYNLSLNRILKTGWIKDNGKGFYLDNTGTMQTGEVIVNNKPYNCSSDGQVVATKLPTVDKVFDLKDNNQNFTVSNLNSCQGTTNTGNTTSTDTGSTTDATTVDVQGLPQLPKTYSINVQASAEDQILQLMNGKRVDAGLQPLTLDNTLVQVARYKSDSMIQYNYFDHTNPDGTQYTNLLQTLGYTYTTAGENIAYNTSDAVELFTQWWNSPGHRANMMNASYTKVGIGVIQGNGEFMGTQDFSN